MAKILSAVAAVMIVLAVTSVSLAQLPTGTILGVVKDSSGSVVPGATVTIRSVDTGVTRTVTSSDDGEYRAPALQVGRYTVRTEKTGFNTETQTGLMLEVTQELVVNISLQVGTTTLEVTVTGEAPVVNTTSGSISGTISEERMAILPLNGRNWVDLILMQPGLEQHKNFAGGTPTGSAGTVFSSNGATTRSNNYMLDGAMMGSFNGAAVASISGSSLGVEGIREFKVETNSFSAEYGLRMGSQATLVTKSGMNLFHGSAFEYVRNDALDAANFFDTPATSGGRRLPPYKQNQFGGSFGGPIRKDKTFFYAVFEGLQIRKGLTQVGVGIPANCRVATANPCAITASNPSGTVDPLIVPLLGNIPGTSNPFFPLPTPGLAVANGYSYPFTKPTSEQYGQIRFDQTFSNKDTAFARYTIDRVRAIQPPVNLPSPIAQDTLYSENTFITASETHVFSPAFLNTARVSLSRTPLGFSEPTIPYPGASGPLSFLPGLPPTYGMGTVNPGGGITGLPSGTTVLQNQRIWAYSDDMFYTRGRHALKFGILVTHFNQAMLGDTGSHGNVVFSNLANFLTAKYTSYGGMTPGSNEFREYTSGTIGFYAQDDFRIKPRLTLNLGLRYEFMGPNFSEARGLGAALRNLATDAATTPGPPVVNSSLKDFSPRLGFAWDIRGNGKTALRGGFAVLYDINNLGAALGQGSAGTPVGTTGLGSSVTTVTAANTSVACPAPASLTIPFTMPACWVGKSIQLPDYNMKQPHLITENLTLEQQLLGGVALSIGYAGSRGFNIINRIEGNPCLTEGVVNGVPNWFNTLGTGGAPKGCPLGRINPNWAAITLATANSQAWYNALQIGVKNRVTKGFQFQANYTWSKNLDTGDGQLPADNSTATIAPGYSRLDKGSAAFDVAQSFRLNLIYSFPRMSAGGLVGGLVNGWGVSSIVSAQTGYPFSVWLTNNRSASGVLASGADRPDIVAGRSYSSMTSGTSTGCGTTTNTTKAIAAGTPLGTPTLWYDPCAFTVEAAGYLGNEGRNRLIGPGSVNVDFSVVKDTRVKYLGELGQLEFRLEMFNIMNHPNFGMPVPGSTIGGVSTAYTGAALGESPINAAGVITGTSTPSRQIQLALRLSF